MRTAKTFLTADEKKAIDDAVSQAEKGTSGEIVPVLATRAASYTQGLYHAALTFAFLASLAVVGVHFVLLDAVEAEFWEIPVWALLPAQFLALLLGYHVARLSPNAHRAFLPRALMQRHVEHAARRAFRELGVGGTKDATGIMIYVSLFERVAVVLADKSIAAKCPQATWDGVRDILIAGMREGQPAKGFTQAIAECGRILSKEFPAKADDVNELPNALRIVA